MGSVDRTGATWFNQQQVVLADEELDSLLFDRPAAACNTSDKRRGGLTGCWAPEMWKVAGF
jgi:hypothetical protein